MKDNKFFGINWIGCLAIFVGSVTIIVMLIPAGIPYITKYVNYEWWESEGYLTLIGSIGFIYSGWGIIQRKNSARVFFIFIVLALVIIFLGELYDSIKTGCPQGLKNCWDWQKDWPQIILAILPLIWVYYLMSPTIKNEFK